MAQKEKRSGELTNKEVERELKRNSEVNENERSYIGSQDTGDDIVRAYGTKVQQNDGLSPDDREKQHSGNDAK